MRKLQYLFMTLSMLFLATPAFAQSAGGGSSSLIPIGAGIGMGIAAGLCGIGQGRAAGSAVEAIARNPGVRGVIQITMLLGLAFIESLALFTFVIIMIKAK